MKVPWATRHKRESVRRIGHGRSSPATDMPTIGWTGVDSNQHTQTPAALVRREPGLATVDWASSDRRSHGDGGGQSI